MKRMMSSLRPFGARSVSMSVTKPYLYCSTSRTVAAVWGTAAMSAHSAGDAGRRLELIQAERGDLVRHIGEAHFGERAAHSGVDAVPFALDRTQGFDAAMLIGGIGAGRQRDRAF